MPASENDNVLTPGFSLNELLAEVVRHYLYRALAEAQGNRILHHEIHITLPPDVRTGAARVIVLYDDRQETHLIEFNIFSLCNFYWYKI